MLKLFAWISYGLSVLMAGLATYLFSPMPFSDFETWNLNQLHFEFGIIAVSFVVHFFWNGWALYKNRHIMRVFLVSLIVGIASLFLLYIVYLASRIS